MPQPDIPPFGKRNAGPRTPAPPSRKRLRPGLGWSIAVAAAFVVGLGGIVLFAPNGGTSALDPNQDAAHAQVIAAQFLSLVDTRPDDAKHYVLAGIESCLPQAAVEDWEGAETKALAVDAYITMLSLLSQDIPPEQRDQKFREWITQAASNFPRDQEGNFKRLVENGLYMPPARQCVSESVQRLMSTP